MAYEVLQLLLTLLDTFLRATSKVLWILMLRKQDLYHQSSGQMHLQRCLSISGTNSRISAKIANARGTSYGEIYIEQIHISMHASDTSTPSQGTQGYLQKRHYTTDVS
jgi:hypothetical protein